MDPDKQRIAALERQVDRRCNQAAADRGQNNRRRHLEVKAKMLAAALNRVRMEAQDLRAELYGREALRNEEMRLSGDERIADGDLLDGFVVPETRR